MKITGTMISVGYFDGDGNPGFQLEHDNGRVITVSGLTREEVSVLAQQHLLARVTLTLAPAGDLPDTEGGSRD
jgi:hypothetical protein